MRLDILKKTIPESWFCVLTIRGDLANYRAFDLDRDYIGDGNILLQCFPLDNHILLCEVAKISDYAAIRTTICTDGKAYERKTPLEVISQRREDL